MIEHASNKYKELDGLLNIVLVHEDQVVRNAIVKKILETCGAAIDDLKPLDSLEFNQKIIATLLKIAKNDSPFPIEIREQCGLYVVNWALTRRNHYAMVCDLSGLDTNQEFPDSVRKAAQLMRIQHFVELGDYNALLAVSDHDRYSDTAKATAKTRLLEAVIQSAQDDAAYHIGAKYQEDSLRSWDKLLSTLRNKDLPIDIRLKAGECAVDKYVFLNAYGVLKHLLIVVDLSELPELKVYIGHKVVDYYKKEGGEAKLSGIADTIHVPSSIQELAKSALPQARINRQLSIVRNLEHKMEWKKLQEMSADEQLPPVIRRAAKDSFPKAFRNLIRRHEDNGCYANLIAIADTNVPDDLREEARSKIDSAASHRAFLCSISMGGGPEELLFMYKDKRLTEAVRDEAFSKLLERHLKYSSNLVNYSTIYPEGHAPLLDLLEDEEVAEHKTDAVNAAIKDLAKKTIGNWKGFEDTGSLQKLSEDEKFPEEIRGLACDALTEVVADITNKLGIGNTVDAGEVIDAPKLTKRPVPDKPKTVARPKSKI